MIAKVSRTDSPEPTATLPASDTSVPAGGVAIPTQPKRRLAWSNSCFVLVVAPRPTPPLIGYRKPCTPVELRSLTKCGRPTAFEVQLLRQIPPKIKRNRMILPPDLGGTPIAVYRLRIRGARLPTNERRFTNMDGRLDETSKHPLLRFLSYLKPNAQLVVGAALMGIGKFTLPLAFATQAAASYYRNYWAGLAGHRLIYDLQCKLFAHLQRLPHSFFDRNPAGAIVSRVLNDVSRANELIDSAFVDVWMDATSLIIVVALLFAMDWRLAVVALAIAPFWVAFIRIFSPRIKAVSHRMQEKVEEIAGEVHERVVGA